MMTKWNTKTTHDKVLIAITYAAVFLAVVSGCLIDAFFIPALFVTILCCLWILAFGYANSRKNKLDEDVTVKKELDRLKKCPFCGSNAVIYEISSIGHSKQWKVLCMGSCYNSYCITPDFPSRETAVRYWNERF